MNKIKDLVSKAKSRKNEKRSEKFRKQYEGNTFNEAAINMLNSQLED